MSDFMEQHRNRIYELRDSIEEQHDLITALYNPDGNIETADLMGCLGFHVTLCKIIDLVADFQRDFPDAYLDKVDLDFLNNARKVTDEGFYGLFKSLGSLSNSNPRKPTTNHLENLSLFYL